MPATSDAIRAFFERLRQTMNEGEAAERLAGTALSPSSPRIRPSRVAGSASLKSAWRTLSRKTAATEADQTTLADAETDTHIAAYGRNIENMIGTVKVPVGVIGPLRVNGLHAAGDYYVPLATTEAALVASYGRGAHVIGLAGGCTAAMLSESVTRSQVLRFVRCWKQGCSANGCWVICSFEGNCQPDWQKQASVVGPITAYLEPDHSRIHPLCACIRGN